jgi:hypothetical protein
MKSVTERKLERLRHMLGIDDLHATKPAPSRNYDAVAAPDMPMFCEMEEDGLVRRVEPSPFFFHDCYECTQDGIDAAMAGFPAMSTLVEAGT